MHPVLIAEDFCRLCENLGQHFARLALAIVKDFAGLLRSCCSERARLANLQTLILKRKESVGMARHVHLRHDPDAPVMRLCDDLLHVFLRVLALEDAAAVQLWKARQGKGEAAKVIQVHLEKVHADQGHALDDLRNQGLLGDKAPAQVDHETTHWEVRPVIDRQLLESRPATGSEELRESAVQCRYSAELRRALHHANAFFAVDAV
mmetsp:Transcript_58374/g.126258  ORF Transcript_58374/g.126258 Transcript_58374/m.126258 type:complete len:206 (+) Transcript_58374:866-1483(+)